MNKLTGAQILKLIELKHATVQFVASDNDTVATKAVELEQSIIAKLQEVKRYDRYH